jgi:pimeloyl-ACP methyl ester carboxylesterase
MDKYFDYKDVKGFYTDEGNGEAILFVHGFAEDGSVWDEFKKAFRGYRTIVPDMPGYRNSSLQGETSSIDEMADFVKAILDREEIDKVNFVGHSMGGYTAVAFAEKYPERLNKLVMFHSHPYADDEEKKKGRIKSADLVKRNGTEVFIRELYNNLFADKFKKGHRDFIDGRIAKAQEYPAPTIIASLLAMAERPDRPQALKDIKIPVLFIIGQEDKAVPHDKSMEQTHLPMVSEVHILQQVGHMGMFEEPEATQNMILNFLQRDLI